MSKPQSAYRPGTGTKPPATRAIPLSGAGAAAPLNPDSSPTATASTPPIRNVFSVLFEHHKNFGVCKAWLSSASLFFPGVLLGLYQIMVLLIAIALWPYGLFMQGAELLLDKIVRLYHDYHSTKTAAEKIALALSITIIAVLAVILAVIALPLIVAYCYFEWLMEKPVLNLGWTLAAIVAAGLACLLVAGMVWFVVHVLPTLLAIFAIIVVIGLIGAIADHNS
jgi:hypothetical protein